MQNDKYANIVIDGEATHSFYDEPRPQTNIQKAAEALDKARASLRLDRRNVPDAVNQIEAALFLLTGKEPS